MRKIPRFFREIYYARVRDGVVAGGEIDGGGRTASHSTQGRTEEGEEMEEGEERGEGEEMEEGEGGGGRKELGGAWVDG